MRAGEAPDAGAANKKLGRGINLGNALEAPKEGEWGVTLDPLTLRSQLAGRLRDWTSSCSADL